MLINDDIKKYINTSVLCWLATVSKDNIPNVSPKEIFAHYKDDILIIANIASPQSAKNIMVNEHICVSFIDILIQKGYQLKGVAKVISNKDDEFNEMKKQLEKMTDDLFPFKEIFKIEVTSAKPIIAPRYLLFPETTEENQINSAIKQYRI